MSQSKQWSLADDVLSTVAGWFADDQARSLIRGQPQIVRQNTTGSGGTGVDGTALAQRLGPDEVQGLDTRYTTTHNLIKRYDSAHNKIQLNPAHLIVHAHGAGGKFTSLDEVTHNAGGIAADGSRTSGQRHTLQGGQYEHHNVAASVSVRMRAHHPINGHFMYDVVGALGSPGVTVTHHHGMGGHFTNIDAITHNAASVSGTGTLSGGHQHTHAAGRYEHAYVASGSSYIRLRAHHPTNGHFIFDNSTGTVVKHHHETSAGHISHTGDHHYGSGVVDPTTGALSGGFAAHRLVAGIVTHTQDANDGNGERYLAQKQAGFHTDYVYSGVTQKTHTRDYTGHTLPDGHTIKDNGSGVLRVQGAGTQTQIAVTDSGTKIHTLTKDQHTHPDGSYISSADSLRLSLIVSGGAGAIKSDSHNVATSVFTVGTGSIPINSSTPVNYTLATAATSYHFKLAAACVYDGGSNPGVYGLNYSHPNKNSGLGGPAYVGGSLNDQPTGHVFWAATFVNVDGTFQVFVTNDSGAGAAWSGTMAIRTMVVNA